MSYIINNYISDFKLHKSRYVIIFATRYTELGREASERKIGERDIPDTCESSHYIHVSRLQDTFQINFDNIDS